MNLMLLFPKHITELSVDTFLCLRDDGWGMKMTKPRGAVTPPRLLTITTEQEPKMAEPDSHTPEPVCSAPMSKDKRLDVLLAKARARGQKSSAADKSPEPDTTPITPLPNWADAVRAVPNAFLRSAVFGAIKPGARAKLNDTLMSSLDGLEVRCTGERLDQGDLDTWLTVLHMCRGKASMKTTGYQILKSLGFPDSGKNRETLEKRLLRIVGHSVKVTQGTRMYAGSLLSGAGRDEATGEWVIDTNPRITRMLGGDNFTLVGWEVRHSLAGQQLAQWLHAFYSSHAEPFPMRIDTLHSLSGSQATVMSDFAKTLRKALESVQKAFQEQGEPFSYELSNGLVSVSRRASNSQRKHLAKKRTSGKSGKG